jgi:hypothetical protein
MGISRMRGLIVETSVTIAASAIMAAMVAAGGVAAASPPGDGAMATDTDPVPICIVQDGARFCVGPAFYQVLDQAAN